MCGIAGFNLNPTEHDIDTPKLARELLLGIEHRGKDATGAAWYETDPNGKNTLMVQKDAMKATHFVKWLDLPVGATNVILHTRMKTKGSPKDNNNNHPVVSGNIVGVHNGGVWNDDSLFRRMNLQDLRVAEVDTEAIFAAIAYGMEKYPDGKARLAATLDGVLEEIEGSAAIAWLETERDPSILQVARISSSPLIIAETKGGSFLFASEESVLRKAANSVGLIVTKAGAAKEGTYFKVQDGDVVGTSQFEPAFEQYQRWSGGYSTVSSKPTVSQSVINNVHKLSPPVKKDDDKKDDAKNTLDQTGFEPYLSRVALYGHLVHRFANDVPDLDDDDHKKHYMLRNQDIEKHVRDFGLIESCRAGADIKEGMDITTDLGHENNVEGQMWLMPQRFPGGTYIIKALIPNSRFTGGYEPVFVERYFGEFEYDSIADRIDAADATAADAVIEVTEDAEGSVAVALTTEQVMHNINAAIDAANTH